MYDVIILGAGPAGLSAGIYASRSMLKTLVIEKNFSGGQIATTEYLENYPGLERVGGMELGMTMEKQAKSFGCEFKTDTIEGVDLEGEVKTVHGKKEDYQAKTIIIAMGSDNRKLGIPGEDEYTGRGISFCATCDGPFYRDKDIYVIGGGNVAVEEALFLTKFGKSVNIVHRRDELRATKIIQERAFENDKINIIWDSVLKEAGGDKLLNYIVLENVKTKERTRIEEEEGMGVFILIGNVPNTKLFENDLDLERGYIRTDEEMRTKIDGVYAVGDCRLKRDRQAITAASDGAIAALSANDYILGK